MPERIQLSRRKGWRKPENTVVVARPTRWGNPFCVRPDGDGWYVDIEGRVSDTRAEKRDSVEIAVQLFRSCLKYPWDRYAPIDVIRSALAGKNLACWCPLDQPCHADVLLELANQEVGGQDA